MKKMSWYIFFSFARTRIETIWYELCHSFCFWELEKEAEKTLAKMLYYPTAPIKYPGNFGEIWEDLGHKFRAVLPVSYVSTKR